MDAQIVQNVDAVAVVDPSSVGVSARVWTVI
jgi:hypothetical protein